MSDYFEPDDAFASLCCFPVAALARVLVRRQQPLLDELGITYPQYLVLMVLYPDCRLPVREICRRLVLNTNTLTPLLQRMEVSGVVTRQRSVQDERVLFVSLTGDGKKLAERCQDIQQRMREEEPELYQALNQIRPDVERALEQASRLLI